MLKIIQVCLSWSLQRTSNVRNVKAGCNDVVLDLYLQPNVDLEQC